MWVYIDGVVLLLKDHVCSLGAFLDVALLLLDMQMTAVARAAFYHLGYVILPQRTSFPEKT